MREWSGEMFSSTALIPVLTVRSEEVGRVRKSVEKYLLKMNNMRPIQDCTDDDDDDDGGGRKYLMLNPELVSSFRDLESSLVDVSREQFRIKKYHLTADNWTPHELLRAVLPQDEEGVSGFSTIGHIVHLNLRQHLEEYKSVIGDILLRLPGVRTVVNKSNSIDNTFRNFSMELLAGEEDYEVTVKESGCVFKLDFSKVYWNPRLATEHDRVIRMMSGSSVMFDACAGVGPFSVPCAKICRVLSNDLNPESYKWLVENVKSNKKSSKNIQCFNKDARDFIRTEVKEALIEIWSDNKDNIDNAHIVMNLPALAITFVDVFHGLFKDNQELMDKATILPQAHIYCFSTSSDPEVDVRKECEGYLGDALDDDHFQGVNFVRNVSPNKDMFRVDFIVPKYVLFAEKVMNGDKRSLSPSPDDPVIKKR